MKRKADREDEMYSKEFLAKLNSDKARIIKGRFIE